MKSTKLSFRWSKSIFFQNKTTSNVITQLSLYLCSRNCYQVLREFFNLNLVSKRKMAQSRCRRISLKNWYGCETPRKSYHRLSTWRTNQTCKNCPGHHDRSNDGCSCISLSSNSSIFFLTRFYIRTNTSYRSYPANWGLYFLFDMWYSQSKLSMFSLI